MNVCEGVERAKSILGEDVACQVARHPYKGCCSNERIAKCSSGKPHPKWNPNSVKQAAVSKKFMGDPRC